MSEDDLEAYVLKHTAEFLTEAVEDHLLLCRRCRQSLDRIEDQIELIRLALS